MFVCVCVCLFVCVRVFYVGGVVSLIAPHSMQSCRLLYCRRSITPARRFFLEKFSHNHCVHEFLVFGLQTGEENLEKEKIQVSNFHEKGRYTEHKLAEFNERLSVGPPHSSLVDLRFVFNFPS